MRQPASALARIVLLLAMLAAPMGLLPVGTARWSQALRVVANVEVAEPTATPTMPPSFTATIRILPQILQKKAHGIPLVAFVDFPEGWDVNGIDRSSLRLCVGDQPCEKGKNSIPPVGRGWLVCHRDGDLPDCDDDRSELPDWLGKEFPQLKGDSLGKCRYTLVLFFEREELYSLIKDKPVPSDVIFTISGRAGSSDFAGNDQVRLVAPRKKPLAFLFKIDAGSFLKGNPENQVFASVETAVDGTDLSALDEDSLRLCLGSNPCSGATGLRPLSRKNENGPTGKARIKLSFDRKAMLALVKGVDPSYSAAFTLAATYDGGSQSFAGSDSLSLAGIQPVSEAPTPVATGATSTPTPKATSGTPIPAASPTPAGTAGRVGTPGATATPAGTPGATPTTVVTGTPATATPTLTGTPATATPTVEGTGTVEAATPTGTPISVRRTVPTATVQNATATPTADEEPEATEEATPTPTGTAVPTPTWPLPAYVSPTPGTGAAPVPSASPIPTPKTAPVPPASPSPIPGLPPYTSPSPLPAVALPPYTPPAPTTSPTRPASSPTRPATPTFTPVPARSPTPAVAPPAPSPTKAPGR